jgi:hypothetical protein
MLAFADASFRKGQLGRECAASRGRRGMEDDQISSAAELHACPIQATMQGSTTQHIQRKYISDFRRQHLGVIAVTSGTDLRKHVPDDTAGNKLSLL